MDRLTCFGVFMYVTFSCVFLLTSQVVVQFSDLHSRNSIKRHRSSSDAPSGLGEHRSHTSSSGSGSGHSSSYHGSSSSSSSSGIAAHGTYSAPRPSSSSSSLPLSRQNSSSSAGIAASGRKDTAVPPPTPERLALRLYPLHRPVAIDTVAVVVTELAVAASPLMICRKHM